MAEEEVKEEQTEETQVDEKWDKERQRADQLDSNLKKVASERDSLQENMTRLQAEKEELERQIKVNQESQVEINPLDPLQSDIPDLVNQNNKVIEELAETKRQLAELKTIADEYKSLEQKRQADARREAAIEEVLGPLDDRFGAKYRAPAKKLADELVQKGEAKQPQDKFEAFLLLEKCYDQVSKKALDKKAEKILPDTGGGGVPFKDSQMKEGSREEVLAEMRKRIQQRKK